MEGKATGAGSSCEEEVDSDNKSDESFSPPTPGLLFISSRTER